MGHISDERGQLIVVSALLIAVLFVGLALVLNSAIYAENLASRGETSTAEAVATGALTEDRLGRMVDEANYETAETATYAERRSHVRENATAWNRFVGEKESVNGNAYTTGLGPMTNGTRVNQSAPDDFEPADSSLLSADPLELGEETDWQTANASEVRAFEMTVRRNSLRQVDTNLTTELEYLLEETLNGTDRFWTQFEDGESTYRVYLLNDDGNQSVAAVVTEYRGIDADGNKLEDRLGVCTAEAPDPSDTVTVRITEAELEGADGTVDCQALETVDDGRLDLYYAGVNNVNGTYRFIADRPEEEFRDAVRETHELLGLTLSNSDIYAASPNDDAPTPRPPSTTRRSVQPTARAASPSRATSPTRRRRGDPIRQYFSRPLAEGWYERALGRVGPHREDRSRQDAR